MTNLEKVASVTLVLIIVLVIVLQFVGDDGSGVPNEVADNGNGAKSSTSLNAVRGVDGVLDGGAGSLDGEGALESIDSLTNQSRGGGEPSPSSTKSGDDQSAKKPGPKTDPKRTEGPKTAPTTTIPDTDLQWVDYTVKGDESLWVIARNHFGAANATAVADLIAHYGPNKITNAAKIREGSKIKIPTKLPPTLSRSAKPKPADGSAAKPSKTPATRRMDERAVLGFLPDPEVGAATSRSNEEAGRTYRVKAGESLSGIVYRIYGSTSYVDEVVKMNNIKNPDRVREGTLLKLPAKN